MTLVPAKVRLIAVLVSAVVATTLGLAASGAPASADPVQAWALRNVATGQCVDDSWQFGLRSFPCNGTTYQKWNYYYQPSTNAWTLQNQYTGRCIDDSSQFGLRAFSCYYTSFQQWGEIPGYDNGPTYGYTNRNTSRCIDDSAPFGLRAFQCNGQPFQRFKLFP